MIKHWFRKKIKLSYGITVCNEAVELERLILFLLLHKDRQDEIIVLQDVTSTDRWVNDVLNAYRRDVLIRTELLNNDFAGFKNKLIDVATGDYLFQIDADEMPAVDLIRKVKPVLVKQRDADCVAVPRINFVKGITPALVDQWNWKLDDKDRINFPDYQLRIFRLNQSIHWRNKVHEELAGFKNCYYLPDDADDFCLIHVKDVDRQQRQNDFYGSI